MASVQHRLKIYERGKGGFHEINVRERGDGWREMERDRGMRGMDEGKGAD